MKRGGGRARATGAALAVAAAVAVLAALCTPTAPAAASGLIGARAATAAVTAGRLDNRPDGAELDLTLSRSVEPSAFVLANPDRVILDLPQVAFEIDPSTIDPLKLATGQASRHAHRARPAPDLVAALRFGLLAPGRSRVVITLATPARIASAAVVRDAAGVAVLQLKLARADRASFEAAALAPQAPAPPAASPQPSPAAWRPPGAIP